jgi:PIN domain nuclease of toxin-antitoxin system
MKLLLDTHILLWWLFEETQLSTRARTALEDPDNHVFVSAASLCEIAIKLSLNKLSMPAGFDRDLISAITQTGFKPLPVTFEHAYAVRWLAPNHGDPVDRLLVAQSLSDGLTLVTKDRAIRRYDTATLW